MLTKALCCCTRSGKWPVRDVYLEIYYISRLQIHISLALCCYAAARETASGPCSIMHHRDCGLDDTRLLRQPPTLLLVLLRCASLVSGIQRFS